MRKYKIQDAKGTVTYHEGTAEETLRSLVNSHVKFVDTDGKVLTVVAVKE